MANLTPNYVDIDFNTMMSQLKSLLAATDTFKDYNFEGANFTILMELVSYLGELNTYYTNQLANNIHPETANVYDTVHSLTRRQGYEPQGYWASTVDINVVITTGTTGTYIIPEFCPVSPKNIVNTDNNVINFTTVRPVTGVVTSFPTTITVTGVVQGIPSSIMKYSYSDLVDNKIILPSRQWDHRFTNQSVRVSVNGVVWDRVETPFDSSTLVSDDLSVYMIKFDKYQRYVLEFMSSKNIPKQDDVIEVIMVETLGAKGDIVKNVEWVNPEPNIVEGVSNVPFIYNQSTSTGVSTSYYTITNPQGSVGSADIETIDELKVKGNAAINSQRRNVTKSDYIGSLQSNSSILKAGVWGEKEVLANTSGAADTSLYNKIYMSIVPKEWQTGGNNDIIRGPLLAQSGLNISGITYGDRSYWNITGISGAGTHYFKGEMVTYNNRIYQANTPFTNYITPIISGTGVSGPPSDVNIGWVDKGPISQFYNFTNITGVVPDILLPRYASASYQTNILTYIEPFKMIGVNELFVLPEVVYFSFDIGLTVKRSYNFISVQQDVKNKLEYYFKIVNRSFGDTIDPREVELFLKDTTIVDTTVNPNVTFEGIKGIHTLTIRGLFTCTPSIIDVGNTIYSDKVFNQANADPNNQPISQFPFYLDINLGSRTVYYNDLYPIRLGYNQFPMLSSDYVSILSEG